MIVGLVANPMSGRDVRRVAASAARQTPDSKRNQIQRALVGAVAGGSLHPLGELPDGEVLLKEAEEVQFWFNARIGRVQWSDPKIVVEFKLDYARRLEEWEDDPAAKAEALWWGAQLAG